MKEFLPREAVSQPVWSHELMASYWSRPVGDSADRVAPIATFGLTHVSLSVAEPELSFQFYERLFGVRELCRDEKSIQALGPGPHDVLVFERRDGHGKPGGIDHIGFRLVRSQDIDHAIEAAKAAGATILRSGEFGPNQPYLYVQDPDGYVLEIWYE